MSVFGTASALTQSTITKIAKDEHPLTLLSGDTITLNMKVMKVFSGDLRFAADESSVEDKAVSDEVSDCSDVESVDSLLPVFMRLRDYELNYGGHGKHSDAVRRRSNEFSAALKAKRDVCVKKAQKDGCGCFMDSFFGSGKQRG